MKISTNCFHCSFFFTLPFFSLIFILIFSMLYLPRSISILWNWCRCFFFILRMRKRKPCIFLSESVKYRVVIYEERLWFWRVCRELGKPCHWFLLCFSCGCFICFFFFLQDGMQVTCLDAQMNFEFYNLQNPCVFWFWDMSLSIHDSCVILLTTPMVFFLIL